MTWLGEGTSGSIPIMTENGQTFPLEPGANGSFLQMIGGIPAWGLFNAVYSSGTDPVTLNLAGRALVSGSITPRSNTSSILAIASLEARKSSAAGANQMSGHLRIGHLETDTSVGTTIPTFTENVGSVHFGPGFILSVHTPGTTATQNYILWGHSTMAVHPIVRRYSLFLLELG